MSTKGFVKGYMTVFLSLALSVTLPLCMVLLHGSAEACTRVEAEAITDIAFDSVLAEYHRELFEEYNLLAIDTSYGNKQASTGNCADHFRTYFNENSADGGTGILSVCAKEVTEKGCRFLTDQNGTPFVEDAVCAIKEDTDLTLGKEALEWLQGASEGAISMENVSEYHDSAEEEVEQAFTELQERYEEDSGVELVDNPVGNLEHVDREGILFLVLGQEDRLSAKAMDLSRGPEQRAKDNMINRGNLLGDSEESLTDTILFREYLLSYMGNYLDTKAKQTLEYGVEYLIAGKESDVDNLKAVATRLSLLRETSNVAYLYSNEAKYTEVEALAMATALLLGMPELQKALETTILFSWAYAESIYDVKVLLNGGKVPLGKTDESWHYSLMGALNQEDAPAPSSESDGLSYRDYLRILLLTEGEEVLSMRALNLIEASIRMTPGNSGFRVDACADMLRLCVEMESGLGYRYVCERQRKYE